MDILLKEKTGLERQVRNTRARNIAEVARNTISSDHCRGRIPLHRDLVRMPDGYVVNQTRPINMNFTVEKGGRADWDVARTLVPPNNALERSVTGFGGGAAGARTIVAPAAPGQASPRPLNATLGARETSTSLH